PDAPLRPLPPVRRDGLGRDSRVQFLPECDCLTLRGPRKLRSPQSEPALPATGSQTHGALLQAQRGAAIDRLPPQPRAPGPLPGRLQNALRVLSLGPSAVQRRFAVFAPLHALGRLLQLSAGALHSRRAERQELTEAQ